MKVAITTTLDIDRGGMPEDEVMTRIKNDDFVGDLVMRRVSDFTLYVPFTEREEAKVADYSIAVERVAD